MQNLVVEYRLSFSTVLSHKDYYYCDVCNDTHTQNRRDGRVFAVRKRVPTLWLCYILFHEEQEGNGQKVIIFYDSTDFIDFDE